jgi:hypothetical protein
MLLYLGYVDESFKLDSVVDLTLASRLREL